MLSRPGALVAQTTPGTRDPVLDHLTREAARLHTAIKDGGLRTEHLRAFSLNLRLASAHGRQFGVDAAIQRTARRAARNRTDLLNGLEAKTDYRHEKHEFERLFPDLKGLDLEVWRDRRTPRAGYEEMLNAVIARGGYTEAHAELLRLSEGIRSQLERAIADNGGVLRFDRPRVVRVQQGSCEVYRMALEMAEIFANVLCALVPFDPPLAPLCTVLWIEVQIAKILMLIACGAA
jgi:hypothetical protein